VAGPNPLREALEAKRFCYVVELVASRLTREARLLEVASELSKVPGVVAGSITSYAGGALGHDPIRVGTAARARGLTPNIHLTCVNRPRADAQRTLEDLAALGIENVFALTGDYPKSPAAPAATPPASVNSSAKPLFELDSVQLTSMIAEMRPNALPFWTAVAVSPFKYTEADCAYQYLKLEKKIAAGANYAITQLGFDARKFQELKRYVDERRLQIPLLGNVYVLPAKAAEKMSKGEPPGCWVAPELLAQIQSEAKAPDKGLAARLERAARMVAILRGLGYAGAYLGGEHRADRVRWIIRRSETIASQWEELAAEMAYAPKGGFYFYESAANSVVVARHAAPDGAGPANSPTHNLGLVPRTLAALSRLFPVNRAGGLRNLLTAVFCWVDRRPALAQAVERVEFAIKRPMFGCEACGNCVLGQMEYVCPQTCPKNLRNGPCGGTLLGRCEVVDKPCIWVAVYDRAKAAERLEDLHTYIPPRNLALQETSSWINYFLERDNRPGRPGRLVQLDRSSPAVRAREEDAKGT
jgi:methylenetetrahydrofolate reductase (NADPH)